MYTSLQSLVEQVEGGDGNLESELVKETEVLLKEFKAHESVQNQLRAELSESHAQLTGTKEQVAALTKENEVLTKQVQYRTIPFVICVQAAVEYMHVRHTCTCRLSTTT